MSGVNLRNRAILLWMAAGLSMTSPAFAAEDAALRVAPRVASAAGGLNVRSPLSPSDNFDFRSCERVVYGEKSTQLFLVKVAGDPTAPGIHWTLQDNTYSYRWKYTEGIQVDFAATADKANSVRLRYTVTNQSQTLMPRVMVHTCVPTTEAPSFFPSPAEHAGVNADGKQAKIAAYLSLNERVFLWSKGKRFAFSETASGKHEIHLAFTREGVPPINWGWWINGEQTFDVPLIAVASKDGQFTAALGFQDGIRATSNTGDDRACFHLFPHFGTLKPGESATVEGRFYILKGGPDAALTQFQKDFPLAASASRPGGA